MLTLLEKGRARARMPRTLILEPTRELAAQVAENFEKYGKNHKLNVALLIGGVSFEDQDRKLERGADVLICTPGRLLDHCERGKLLMTGVEILVIDEADERLDVRLVVVRAHLEAAPGDLDVDRARLAWARGVDRSLARAGIGFSSSRRVRRRRST
jgi:superfamily II DNA or RNA helicase